MTTVFRLVGDRWTRRQVATDRVYGERTKRECIRLANASASQPVTYVPGDGIVYTVRSCIHENRNNSLWEGDAVWLIFGFIIVSDSQMLNEKIEWN